MMEKDIIQEEEAMGITNRHERTKAAEEKEGQRETTRAYTEATSEVKAEAAEVKEQARKTIEKLKTRAQEEDPKLSPTMTLRTILGGDFLTAEMVREQIGVIMIVVVFTVVYVAFRYQCQQDLIAIDKAEKELLDAKYKALSSKSTLTEKCRESRVLDALKANKDSVLKIADQPPYIINVEKNGI